jgi:hypothetical protein
MEEVSWRQKSRVL